MTSRVGECLCTFEKGASKTAILMWQRGGGTEGYFFQIYMKDGLSQIGTAHSDISRMGCTGGHCGLANISNENMGLCLFMNDLQGDIY